MKPDLDHYSRRVPAHLPAKVIVPAQEQTGIQNNRAAKRQQRNVVSFIGIITHLVNVNALRFVPSHYNEFWKL
ncbi:MAG: hypothetical protein DME32_03305 [Verrucomicrobia bacterium]|nr:MAG: hypothetical protein DME32_03305 [Verrucomicrobiota bacterium]